MVAPNQEYKTAFEQVIKELALEHFDDIKSYIIATGLNESGVYKMFEAGKARADSIKKLAAPLGIDYKELQYKIQYKDSPSKAIVSPRHNINIVPSSERTKLYLSQLPEKEAELYVPYYDIEITAGQIEHFFEDEDEIPNGYVYAPQYRGCLMCNVKGNSMYDLIYPGARLYVFRMNDLKYIDYGQIYLVVTKSLRVLKYIRRHPSDETKVVLASHNKDHDSWDVEKADILNLFMVKGYENQTAM